MITVINAGGSGTRLWPLSTSEYPKHLLKLTGERTLLQSAYDRAKQIGDKIYVVTEAGHAHHVKEQLPELDDESFLIEPGRRGTAHAILMALDYISRHHDRSEPVAFVHSDHHIRDSEGFKRSFAAAADNSSGRGEITLIGIEPSFPATGFGYIERDGVIDEGRGVYEVKSFKEKPAYDLAQKYVESGRYFWNCGYFVGSCATFIREIERSTEGLWENYQQLKDLEFGSEEYKQKYLSFDTQVIDVALIEKAKHLAVVAASFDWVDVGSFKDLHDVVAQDEEGNHHFGENIHDIENQNTYIRNEEAKPVAVIGLDNIVVVNTPDGLLVARKGDSQKVGEIAKKLQKEK